MFCYARGRWREHRRFSLVTTLPLRRPLDAAALLIVVWHHPSHPAALRGRSKVLIVRNTACTFSHCYRDTAHCVRSPGTCQCAAALSVASAVPVPLSKLASIPAG